MKDHENDDKTQTHAVLTSGTVVSHYRIVKYISAGGMGEIYLAEDTSLRRQVALKFLPHHLTEDAEVRARFTREAQAAAKLDHPNIVMIHEVGDYNGRPFFAMQYIDGNTLHHYCHQETLPNKKIIEIVAQIADGLARAHADGIVHRDIKSANIIIDSELRPKILDFGLAVVQGAEALTRAGTTVGTAAYMSPEQAQGHKIDHRSDLFSLGIVLYELVAGRTPFRKDTEAATLHAIVHDESEPLARYRSGVSEGLQQIVDKLLEKDPGLRYQSAAGVAADLRRELRQMESGESSITRRASGGSTIMGISPVKKAALFGTPLVAIILLLLILKPWGLATNSTGEAVAGGNRLAAMYFDNLVDPADSTRLGEIVTNLLITDLSESEHLRVVSSQRMYDILKQLGKENTHAIDRQTATQVATIAGARWMLTGTILQMQPSVVITTQIIDVKSGQVEASQKSTSEKDEDIFAQVDRLSSEIRQDLAIPGLAGEASDRRLSEVVTSSPEAYRYYLEGVDYLRRLYRTDARRSFLKAIEHDSTFAMAHYMIGAEFFDINHVRKAVKYSNNAGKADRLKIMAFADHMAGDLDGAVATYKQIIAEFPDDKIAYMQLAEIYNATNGMQQEGIKLLEKVLELDPHEKLAYNQMAYIYKGLGEYGKAIEVLDKYAEIVPDEPNPYDSRGEMYAAAGDYDLAIASYRLALSKDPEFLNALRCLAILYALKGEYEKSDSCAKALANNAVRGVRVDGRALLGVSAVQRGQLNKALEIIDNGIAADTLEGAEGNLRFSLKFAYQGISLNYLDRHQEALAKIELARRFMVRASPEAVFPFTGEYAVTLAYLGEFERAAVLLDEVGPKVITSGNNFYIALFYTTHGRIEFIRGNYPDAIAYLDSARNANSEQISSRAEYFQAIAYIENAQPAKAVPLLERFTTTIRSFSTWIPIENVLGHYYLGIAYEDLGKTEKAVEQYETFLEIWKDADPEIKYLDMARERLGRLKNQS